jgi:hypothetical protein
MGLLAIDLTTNYSIDEINNIDLHVLNNETRITLFSTVITNLPGGDYNIGQRLFNFNGVPNGGFILLAYRIFLNSGAIVSNTLSVALTNRTCTGFWVFRNCRDGVTTATILASR